MKLKITALTLALTLVTAFGFDIKLSWTDPNPAGSIIGYRIYSRTNNVDEWVMVENVTQPSVVFSNLNSGQFYYFSITAESINEIESSHSATYPLVQPLAPIDIKVEIP